MARAKTKSARKARAKRNPGRPSKYTQARRDRILEALAEGHYVETAARLGGISPTTYYEWVAELPEFAEATQKARAKAEDDLVGHIRAAAAGVGELPPQWTAAAWILERTRPERFGRIDRSKIEVTRAEPAQRDDFSKLSDEELAQLEVITAKLRPTAEGGGS